MSIKKLFLLCFFSILIPLNVLVGVFMTDWFYPLSVIAFIILELVNILVAYRLSEFICSLLVRDDDLPSLPALESTPSVALLYTTFNDAMSEVLESLTQQTYPNYKIFILDDSTDSQYRSLIDSYGYRTVRRTERTGFKGGALNNWLSLYGRDYQYFIILDSDSLLDNDFVERMVRYGEHPANSNVAIFQSKWRIWNTQNRFPRLLGSILPLWFFPLEKLANEYETPLVMGHNNMFRVALLEDVGGFDERFVCEDLATSLNVLEQGYECKYVNVISYEASPETIKSYATRHIRWATGTVEVAKQGTRDVSFITNLHLLIAALSYLIYIAYLPGMLILTWGFASSITDVSTLFDFIFSGAIIHTWLFAPMALIGFYIVNFMFLRLYLARKLHIPSKTYLAGMLVFPTLDIYMMIPLIVGLIRTLFGEKVRFTVTDKKTGSVSFLGIVRQMKFGLILWALLVIGVAHNPITLVFNFFWIIPYAASPFVLYTIQRAEPRQGRLTASIDNMPVVNRA